MVRSAYRSSDAAAENGDKRNLERSKAVKRHRYG